VLALINLGLLTDDRREDVLENHERLAEAVRIPRERFQLGRRDALEDGGLREQLDHIH